MNVTFVDLDRTLLDVNSGHLWLKHEWRQGRLPTTEIARAAWWMVRYALGDDALEDAITHAATLYAGVPEAEMTEVVERWFAAEVAPRIRPGALPALAEARARGERIVLATTSSQWAAACAARAWGLDDVVSTRAEVLDGVITGRLEHNAFGRHKLDRCVEWADARSVDLADCAFYTDSYSDLALLERVGRPFVVSPDRRLARTALDRGWPRVDWGRAA